MAEWLGNGLQNHVEQFDSAWHLTYWLLVLVLLIMWLVRGVPRERHNLICFREHHSDVLFFFICYSVRPITLIHSVRKHPLCGTKQYSIRIRYGKGTSAVHISRQLLQEMSFLSNFACTSYNIYYALQNRVRI